MSYKNVGRDLEMDHSLVRCWVKSFQAEGPGMGKPRTRPEDPEVKLKRLEAENEMLKKLLQM
ncbi:transposase [Paenibacillus terrae]|nr:transposase [Paenibacillus terrae]